MPRLPNLRHGLLAGTELVLSALPRRPAETAAWENARIVAHRGAHIETGAPENTLSAFEPLLDSGVWGVEFDLRWTADLEPVVVHDPALRRVFGLRLRPADLRFRELRRQCPQVPHLAEVVDRYGGRLHLMLELKAENYPDPDRQRQRLDDGLADLSPVQDFHILALEPELFRHVPGVPRTAWVAVATTNVARISEFALREGCGGIAGPAALLGSRYLARHRAAGQAVGVGFPFTRGLCERELLRGVDWLFSDRPMRLARWRDQVCS